MVDVQGTKAYMLHVPNVEWANCRQAINEITRGVEVLCVQAFGDFSRTETVIEYGCISNNKTMKSTGTTTYGELALEMLFDTSDIAGQKLLLNAMEYNFPLIVALKSPDGSFIFTKGLVSSDVLGYPVDEFVSYDVTLSTYGEFSRCSPDSYAKTITADTTAVRADTTLYTADKG